jgi:uncharacterized membrane protein (DUF485 family)
MEDKTKSNILIVILLSVIFYIGYCIMSYGRSIMGTDSMGDSISAPIPFSGMIYIIGTFIMLTTFFCFAYLLIPAKSEPGIEEKD